MARMASAGQAEGCRRAEVVARVRVPHAGWKGDRKGTPQNHHILFDVPHRATFFETGPNGLDNMKLKSFELVEEGV